MHGNLGCPVLPASITAAHYSHLMDSIAQTDDAQANTDVLNMWYIEHKAVEQQESQRVLTPLADIFPLYQVNWRHARVPNIKLM